MPVIVDTRSNGTFTAGATTISWTHTVSAGLTNGILVVGVTTGKAAPHATVSGVNWDDLGTPVALAEKGVGIQDSANQGFADIWYLLNPSPGTKTIKVTASTSCEITGASASYQSVDQVTVFNAASPQTQIGTATGALPALSVTSAVGEMVFDCVVDDEAVGNDVLVQGGGQTLVGMSQVGANTHSGGSSDAPGAATVSMTWTGLSNTNPWAQIGVSLKAAAIVATNISPMPFYNTTHLQE
jgi:hypothetical protein